LASRSSPSEASERPECSLQSATHACVLRPCGKCSIYAFCSL
jgi:hypothetical protein